MPLLSVEEMLQDEIIQLRAELAEKDGKIAALAVRNTELVIRIDELDHLRRHIADELHAATWQLGETAKLIGPQLPTHVQLEATARLFPATATLIRLLRELKEGRCRCIDAAKPAPAAEPAPATGGKVIDLGARIKRRPTIYELPETGKKG